MNIVLSNFLKYSQPSLLDLCVFLLNVIRSYLKKWIKRGKHIQIAEYYFIIWLAVVWQDDMPMKKFGFNTVGFL